jgi:acyl-lipid omega-6 desaturase (Delta-12 desaturase)
MTRDTKPAPAIPPVDITEWKSIVAEFQKPSTGRALWQILNTLGPYVLLWYLMHLSLTVSWWLTVPLAVLAGAFLVRVFIIFHDCGHGSFFKSRRANDAMGMISGVLTLTPYYQWRWEHATHHASAGDLDKRGIGDVWTMTVQEYLESSRWQRFAYRLARNPVVLLVLAPLFMFVILQRFPATKANPRERRSVHWNNLCILAMATVLSWTYGLVPYLLIQLTVMAVAGGVGVWMFYVQHQFEDVYWERSEEWDFTAAALQGSSFYKLPGILQWFSGNIGFHHIHHLSSRIPNYNLERCHRSHSMFRDVKPITMRTSLKSFPLRLWDENLKKLVGYRHIKHLPRKRARSNKH